MLENSNIKKLPFKVPENYFENFNKEIMAKLPQEQDVVIPRKMILWKRVAMWSAAAAMLSAILLSVSTALNTPNSNPYPSIENAYVNSKTSNTIDENEFLNYIEEQSFNAVYNETLLN